MQNNKVILTSIIALLIGILLGTQINSDQKNLSHRMPDGTMMMNNHGEDMDSMMKQMNVGLLGKSGDEFDKAFLSEMIIHHEEAVEMAKLALTNAKHQEIKDLSKAIIEAQNKEITSMKTWHANWFK